MASKPRIKIVCAKCGSDDVRRDATAAWSVTEQQWELCGVQDQGYCEACEDEADLEEEEIEQAAEAKEVGRAPSE
jgi:ribosomal protein L37AE/L43A